MSLSYRIRKHPDPKKKNTFYTEPIENKKVPRRKLLQKKVKYPEDYNEEFDSKVLPLIRNKIIKDIQEEEQILKNLKKKNSKPIMITDEASKFSNINFTLQDRAMIRDGRAVHKSINVLTRAYEQTEKEKNLIGRYSIWVNENIVLSFLLTIFLGIITYLVIISILYKIKSKYIY